MDYVLLHRVLMVLFSPGYQVTITFLVPDPAELDCTWNVENATNCKNPPCASLLLRYCIPTAILLPFISSKGISRLGKFTISSQVNMQLKSDLNSSALFVNPRRICEGYGTCFVIHYTCRYSITLVPISSQKRMTAIL